MKAGPGFKYPLENELLFGEKIEINKVTGDWFFCQSLLDGYLGWINIKYLSDVIDVNHRVINLRSNLYEKDNLKANILFHLPLGSKLNVIKEKIIFVDHFFGLIQVQNGVNSTVV